MATKRLIDANDALERLEKAEQGMMVVSMVGCKAVPMHGVIEFIKTRPTVDAVEVVRCKECKNRDDITGECKHPRAVGWDVIIPEDNDFCSYGERKDNDISAGEGHSGIC